MIPADLIPEWMARGLCAEIDPELWFPTTGDSNKPAKAICAQCPVRIQCLDDALTQEFNPDGIWGGLTFQERIKLRQERRAAA